MSNDKKLSKIKDNDSSKIIEAIYEQRYYDNINRSFKQVLSSKLYPLSLLLHKNKFGGFKNTLVTIKGYNAIRKSELFDVGYYLNNNVSVRKDGMDVILHYLYFGYDKGFKPSKYFNPSEYLSLNSDIKLNGMNPLVHYLLYGQHENRKISQKLQETKVKKVKTTPQKEVKPKKNKPKKNKPKKNKPKKNKPKKNKPKKNKNTKGSFQKVFKANLIEGWIAEIGNNNPIKASISIDNHKFTIKPNIYNNSLKEKGINNGNHSFKFIVPDKYLDGQYYTIKLFDDNEFVIDSMDYNYKKVDFESEIRRYLAYSMTSPYLIFPFSGSDKKMIAIMENIANYLVKQVPLEKPLVSIIMTVKNKENTIVNSINSVLNQTYENIELIIVDNNSTDNTYAQIKQIKDNRIKLLNNKETQNKSILRNKALKESSGKYITYLDDDNQWDKRYIATMVGAFSILNDANALYCGQYNFVGSKNNLESIEYAHLNKGLLSNRNYINLNTFCHKRELYEEYGGFDESLKMYSEWDLILKYSTHAKTYSIPAILLNNYAYDENNMEYKDIVYKKQKERIDNLSNNNHTLTKGVSVIIPSYESLSDLKNCLESLFRLNSNYIEIVVVDNNSSIEVKDYLKNLKKENKIKLILNDINYGFTYAINQAISISKKDNDIVLLNNDAIVTKNALCYLQKAAYKLENCGVTVPQQVLPANTKTIQVHVPYASVNYECDVNLSNHHSNIINLPLFHNGRYTELSFAAFFCVYIKREVYDKSLGFDAEYGRHYRSDVIFCNFIRNVLNYKIYHVSDAIVYHKLQKSTAILREKSKKQHDIMFIKNRWSSSERKKLGYKEPIWDLSKDELEKKNF